MKGDPIRHLATLGLKVGASTEDVKKAYRDLSKVWHPDRFREDPKLQLKAEEQLKAINNAYEHLKSYEPPTDADAWVGEGRIPSGGRRSGRLARHRARFKPTERLPLVMVIVAVLVALLLVWTAL